MATGKNGRELKVQGVSFWKDQLEWAGQKHINLSGLIRDLLDAYIIAEDAPRRDPSAPEATAAVNA
jgi:hypothetical protein